MSQHQIVIGTPAGIAVWMIPQPHSTKIQCFYESDDPLAINLAAQYLIREGWLEYVAGTFEPKNNVVELIHSVEEAAPK